MIRTYDCTSGGYQFCQGCYTMEESLTNGEPDGYGEWVDVVDHRAEVEKCSQEILNLRDELSRAQARIAFLHKQIIIEQSARREVETSSDIIKSHYEQVLARWHKLMERRDLQGCNYDGGNRVTE